MAVIQGVNAAGANPAIAALSTGIVENADAYGRYTAAVLRGNCYALFDATGKTIPAGLSTAPVNVTLYNPLGSGVILSLLYSSLAFTIVQVAVTAYWIGVTPGLPGAPSATAVTGTVSNPTNMNGGGSNGKVRGFTTATLATVPVIGWQLGAGLTGAATTIPVSPGFVTWHDGLLQVGPGGSMSFQGSAVGPTNGAWGGWIFEELPTSLTAI